MDFPQTLIFSFPTVKEIAGYISGELKDPWVELRSSHTAGMVLFLVGGAAADVQKSFGDFAEGYSGRVFAAMPPRARDMTMDRVLEELGPSLKRRLRDLKEPFAIGGLSFGATVAMELARHWADAARYVVLLDPRNIPPYSLPAASLREPLWYERICIGLEACTLPMPAVHVLASTVSRHHNGFKASASEGFQLDAEVHDRLEKIFRQAVLPVPTNADHFEFLDGESACELAEKIVEVMKLEELNEAAENIPGCQRPNMWAEVAGFACNFPAGQQGFDAVLQSLLRGSDGVSTVPFSRLDLDVSSVYTTHAACIPEVEFFDHESFKIKIPEAQAMDPQQRVLLEQSAVALGSLRTLDHPLSFGVWIGQANHDWLCRSWQSNSPFAAGGASPSISANRLSYIFRLLGPSVVVDTACTHVFADVHMFAKACSTTALSTRGRCFTFDASADGYSRGEG
ncbi:mlcA, partial [Symbiodinium microadriaticum]